jgi:hypothetical protein
MNEAPALSSAFEPLERLQKENPAMKKLSIALLCVSWIASSSCSDCSNSGSGGLSAVEVQFMEPTTVITTQNLDGTVTVDHGGDPELVGTKEVGIQIIFREPRELLTTLLTFWPAGYRESEETIEYTHNQSYEPSSPAGIAVSVRREIPGSEELQMCEGMYYMWTVTHRPLDGEAGVFIGQPRLLLPTKRRLPTGQIEQALCSEPPGP